MWVVKSGEKAMWTTNPNGTGLDFRTKSVQLFAMSRQLEDIEVKFSFSALAIAGAIGKRAVQHLYEARLLPEGKGTNVLKRVAVVGGFVGVGVPLLAAGRIASAILDEFNQYDGEVPTGLPYIARNLPSEDRLQVGALDDDYACHSALFEFPELYKQGVAMPSDALIEIVDKTFLFHSQAGGLKSLSPFGNNTEEASYAGRIEGWARGEDAYFVPVTRELTFDSEDPNYSASAQQYNHMANHVRNNAVGKLTVNVSLAIRNGLDRLAQSKKDLREKRKAKRKVTN